MSAVTLDEVKAHLNLSTGTGPMDTELGAFLDRAEAAIVARCGPLVSESVTERVRGSRRALSVSTTPVLSVTSVTPVAGSALTVADLVVDGEAGVIEMLSGSSFGSSWYDVVFAAGHGANAQAVPADLRLALLELVRHLWATQRGGGTARIGSPPSDSSANTVPGAAYLFPFRVEQLLAPYVQIAI